MFNLKKKSEEKIRIKLNLFLEELDDFTSSWFFGNRSYFETDWNTVLGHPIL